MVLRKLTKREHRLEENTHPDGYRESDIKNRLSVYPDAERQEYMRDLLECWWDLMEERR